jgi:hypothetical protein
LEVGRALTHQEIQIFRPYFAQIVLEKARVVDGKVPFWLRRGMCAVVLGTCIYFRPNYYQPNTKSGVNLLGHELTHVSQYLFGMTWLQYFWSCRYGYNKSIYEIEACTKGDVIARNFDDFTY